MAPQLPLLFPSGPRGRKGGYEGAGLLAFLGRGMAREVKWPARGHTAVEQVAQQDVGTEGEVTAGPAQRTNQPLAPQQTSRDDGPSLLSLLSLLSIMPHTPCPFSPPRLPASHFPVDPLVSFLGGWLSQGACGVSPALPGTQPFLLPCGVTRPGCRHQSQRGWLSVRLGRGTWASHLPSRSLSPLV